MSEPAAPMFHLAVSLPWYKKARTKWLVLAGLTLVVLGIWTCSRRAYAGTKLAKQAVIHFHQQFNQKQYSEIYVGATQVFRDAAPEPDATAFFNKVHQKLGDEIRAGEPTFFANVTTGGTFITLTYDTDFVLGKGKEKFLWKIEDGSAYLVRYDINSRDLIMK